MTKLCFALLAHNKPDCLADLVANIRHFAPGSDIVLFNGGRDPNLADGLGIDVCPYSRPLEYERVARFHYEVMRWLAEERRTYDFLVTLDSDVLLIKPGLDAYLSRVMQDSAYMAVLFRQMPPWTPRTTGRRFNYKWEGIWQPLFGTRYPYGAFNPGQVFRHDYAARLLQFPQLEELLTRIDQSSLRDLEEMVWATMAVTLGCKPRNFPYPVASAVRYLERHSPLELQRWVLDPNVYFVHPITMTMDAPDRRLVRELSQGRAPDYAAYQAEFESYQASLPLPRRLRTSVMTPILTTLYDAYLQVVSE